MSNNRFDVGNFTQGKKVRKKDGRTELENYSKKLERTDSRELYGQWGKEIVLAANSNAKNKRILIKYRYTIDSR